MERRFHIPKSIGWQTGTVEDAAERARLQRTILAGLLRAVEGAEPGVASYAHAGTRRRGLFTLASYNPDEEGPGLVSQPRNATLATTPAPPPVTAQGGAAMSREQIVQYLEETFGTALPVGQTHYGVQTPAGILIGTGVAGGQVQLGRLFLRGIRQDVEGGWRQTGTETAFAPGRYIFRVVGEAEPGAPHPRVAVVTDLQGRQVGKRIWTRHEVGFQVVFDVTSETWQGGAGDGAARGGGGILPGGIGGTLVPLQCRPVWDTRALSDPASESLSDDELWRLFLNLCNARAIDNLDLSERFVRGELLPRYTGPNGAVNMLSDLSISNIGYFQENLQLLRGLLTAYHKLSAHIEAVQTELDALLFSDSKGERGMLSPLGFGAQKIAPDMGWPRARRPGRDEAARADELLRVYREKSEAFGTTIAAISRLIHEEPLLSFFVNGLTAGEPDPEHPHFRPIHSELAEEESIYHVQQQILLVLDDILRKIDLARHLLCRVPERVLDVPLVYEKVRADLEGINPRFDEVARARIAEHKSLEQWTDIGLGAAGLVLFVGGLVVSIAGGPAGVIVFIEAVGVGLGGVQALRSFDKATALNAFAGTSPVRGGGLASLEAAQAAQFWAAVDAVMAGVDLTLAARSVAQLRRARVLANASRDAEELARSMQAAERLDFVGLLDQISVRRQLTIDPAEVARIQSLLAAGRRSMGDAGELAEEIFERAILRREDYLPLATKFRNPIPNSPDVGIDLMFVRRRLLEEVFGPVSGADEAQRVVAAATEEQLRRLSQAVMRGGSPDNIVAIEVKLRGTLRRTEELLSASATGGRIQQNRLWYSRLIERMKATANAEVHTTAHLLEKVIGPDAAYVERLTRLGVTITPEGGFTTTRLTDEIIEAGQQIGDLTNGTIRTTGLALRRLEREIPELLLRPQTPKLAERIARKQARVAEYQRTLEAARSVVADMDAAIARAKRAQETTRLAGESWRRTMAALADLDNAAAAPAGIATTQALHTANALARTYLEATLHRVEEAENEYRKADAARVAAEQQSAEIQAATEKLLRESPELFEP